MFDISFPKVNEEDMIKRYVELGYKNVVIAKKVENPEGIKDFKRNFKYFPKINVFYMVVIDTNSRKYLNRILPELFYNSSIYIDLVVVKARDFDFNRFVLDKYYHNGILNPGIYNTEDKLDKVYTSLSLTSLKKILENKQAVFINPKEYMRNYVYLRRLLYLIKIFNKKNIPTIIGSFSQNPEEVPKKEQLIAMAKVLGIKYEPKIMFREFFYRQIYRTRKAKNPDVFSEGYEIIKHPYEDCREF